MSYLGLVSMTVHIISKGHRKPARQLIHAQGRGAQTLIAAMWKLQRYQGARTSALPDLIVTTRHGVIPNKWGPGSHLAALRAYLLPKSLVINCDTCAWYMRNTNVHSSSVSVKSGIYAYEERST